MTMTPESASAAASSETAQYAQLWADGFAKVLQQIHGSAIACVVLSEIPEQAAAGPEDLLLLVACSGGLRGEMSLRTSAESTIRLAQNFLNESFSPDTTLSADHRDAVLELARQVAGVVTDALKPRWGEVQIRIEPTSEPSWPPSAMTWLRAGEGDYPAFAELRLSAPLLADLRPQENADAPSLGTAAAVAGDSLGVSQNVRHDSAFDPAVNLDLLMDVELGLTLRFGSRRLLLREVLDLAPGSVVELDRQIDEPVDVLLGGRVVARGEVVVLEGNYAVKVIEVAPAGN